MCTSPLAAYAKPLRGCPRISPGSPQSFPRGSSGFPERLPRGGSAAAAPRRRLRGGGSVAATPRRWLRSGVYATMCLQRLRRRLSMVTLQSLPDYPRPKASRASPQLTPPLAAVASPTVFPKSPPRVRPESPLSFPRVAPKLSKVPV